MARVAVGLDIGHRLIKLVQLVSRRGRLQLVTAQAADTPEGALREGLVVQPESLAAALAELFRRAGVDSINVCVGITFPEADVRVLQMPPLPDKEMSEALGWELKEVSRYQHVDIEDIIFDYHQVGQVGDDVCRVVVVSVSREGLTPYFQALRQAGISPDILDLSLLALPWAVPQMDGLLCHLHLGYESTQLLIEDDGEYVISRVSEVAGRSFQEAMIADGMSSEEAQQSRMGKEVDQLIGTWRERQTGYRQVMDELVAFIFQTFEYVRTRGSSGGQPNRVGQVLLSGGEALTPGLTRFLSEELSVPVDLVDPLMDVSGAHGDGGEDLLKRVKSRGPLYAPALGLAKRGIDEL